MTLTILQTLLFFGYTYYIYKRFGVLTSISASTYKLKGMKRWLFFGTLATVGALNYFQGLAGWGVFAGVFLAFAGITLDHGEDKAKSNWIHSIGTVGAIVLTYVGLLVMHGMWLQFPLLVLLSLPFIKNKNFIWWAECIAMGIAMGAYILR